MTENLYETQYEITKKTKLKQFYESNKILIFSLILIFIIFISSFAFYLENEERKKILLSENYIQVKIYLEKGSRAEALDLLEKVVFANDPTYSTLCFFLIINQNLITDHDRLSFLYDHLISNNKLEKEVKNLLIYKKALLNSDLVDETELLKAIKPLLNNETLWKPHALLLLGDYFLSKKKYFKAKEFYSQILLIKNLQKDFYDLAGFQLAFIFND